MLRRNRSDDSVTLPPFDWKRLEISALEIQYNAYILPEWDRIASTLGPQCGVAYEVFRGNASNSLYCNELRFSFSGNAPPRIVGPIGPVCMPWAELGPRLGEPN